MHRRDPAVPLAESAGAMAELVRAGKVRLLGLSEVTGAELREAYAVHPIAAVQSEWSIFARDVERNVVPAAAELGVAFVPYSPLARGLLTGAFSSSSAAELSPDDSGPRYPRAHPAGGEPRRRGASALRTGTGRAGAARRAGGGRTLLGHVPHLGRPRMTPGASGTAYEGRARIRPPSRRTARGLR
jgi:aryl-alcohol dehydrogenase-like predicted oxidoreductase